MSQFFPNPVGAGVRSYAGPFQLLSPSGVLQFSTNTAGNVVIAAPSSGVSLTATVASGQVTGLRATGANVGDVEVLADTSTNGDAYFRTTNFGGVNWSFGNQRSSNAWVLAQGVGLGTNPKIAVGQGGNVTISAPASGNTLTVGGAAGGYAVATTATASVLGFLMNVTVQPALVMNSTGSDFGTIGNTATQIWSLGHSPTPGSSNTAVLSWNSSGNVTIAAPSSGTALTVSGASGAQTLVVNAGLGQNAGEFIGANVAGNSFGPIVIAGTNASDQAFVVQNRAGSANYFIVRGDGSTFLGPTANSLIINSAGNITVATPSSGVALSLNGAANQYVLTVQGSGTSSQSFGVRILAGTNSSDFPFVVTNALATINYFLVRGDGVVFGTDSANNLFELGYKDSPLNTQSSNYVAAVVDRGKTINASASISVTINSGVFLAGAVVSVSVGNGATVTIVQGAGMTLQWVGNGAATGTRTLTGAGLATLLFLTSSAALISGGGLS